VGGGGSAFFFSISGKGRASLHEEEAAPERGHEGINLCLEMLFAAMYHNVQKYFRRLDPVPLFNLISLFFLLVLSNVFFKSQQVS
jgi:hypothetical protein